MVRFRAEDSHELSALIVIFAFEKNKDNHGQKYTFYRTAAKRMSQSGLRGCKSLIPRQYRSSQTSFSRVSGGIRKRERRKAE